MHNLIFLGARPSILDSEGLCAIEMSRIVELQTTWRNPRERFDGLVNVDQSGSLLSDGLQGVTVGFGISDIHSVCLEDISSSKGEFLDFGNAFGFEE